MNGTLLSNGSLTECFASAKVFVLSNGDVIMLGGASNPGSYEIRTQTGAPVRTGTLINGFDNNSGAVQIGNNVFLFEQGFWEYIGFDGNANTTFDSTGSLFDNRYGARGVVTSTGKIFITGGINSPSTWEMYTPGSNTVTLYSDGLLFDTRYPGHTLTHF
jgi:hypothetical protein